MIASNLEDIHHGRSALVNAALLLTAWGSMTWISPWLTAASPVRLWGELKQWHKVTLDVTGPLTQESDGETAAAGAPNPFLDYRLTITLGHESDTRPRVIPGYFAADGNAAETSATAGTVWRAHFAPDKPGRWTYAVAFVRGPEVAVSGAPGEPVLPAHGQHGDFIILPSDKSGRDFRAHGRLQYEGSHYLRFAGSGEHFLKAGADAPETLLAYVDFDGTRAHIRAGTPARPGEAAPTGLKTWAPHRRDWHEGDPSWQGGKGKGLLGALNYLAAKGCNAFSFLPYNAGGDGDNVWPFVERDDKLHYDCSKLDQWGIVFDHATRLGLFLHFKLQENELDDERLGAERKPGRVPTALDGGALGRERKLYLRELIARFSHALALNWNLGEENTQTPDEQRAMAKFIADTDPYDHLIVVHTFPQQQDEVYPPLLGSNSVLAGASLQNHWDDAHRRTLKWLRASVAAGRPWVVCNDEQGDAGLGVPPDPGYAGFSGKAREKSGREYDLHDIRKRTLWGTLMAGGAGVEYYFGYQLPQNDLACEDWRSRDRSWDYCRLALDFFRDQRLPFAAMANADELVGNPRNDDSRYCLGRPGELYLVYLPTGGTANLDLSAAAGAFTVRWFDPRQGGPLREGSIRTVSGGAGAALGDPPADASEDWLVVVRRETRER